MQNHGLIIRRLRSIANLNIRQAAERIGRGVGWLSEIENGRDRAKLTEAEFNRVVDLLDGAKYRSQFRLWVANLKNRERSDKSFEGAILRFIRMKKNLPLREAAQLAGTPLTHLSRLETGRKVVTLEMRKRLMTAYGYSPSSWKNLSTHPTRSKAIPIRFKLAILINSLSDRQLEDVFNYSEALSDKTSMKEDLK